MRRIETGLPGVHVLEPRAGGIANTDDADAAIAIPAGMSLAASQTLLLDQDAVCGLHYPWPDACGRLIHVTRGEVYAAAVDIRHGAPSFAQRAGVVLSAANRRRLWIPEGFAHGLCALSAHAECVIQPTRISAPGAIRAIRWNDATIAVDWPISRPRLSERDANAPFLDKIEPRYLPAYAG